MTVRTEDEVSSVPTKHLQWINSPNPELAMETLKVLLDSKDEPICRGLILHTDQDPATIIQTTTYEIFTRLSDSTFKSTQQSWSRTKRRSDCCGW